ncbi:unnamed protein product, partial [Prorocentrum cordatum]
GPVVAVAGSQRQHAAGDRVARADGRTYRPPRRGRLRRKMGVSAEQLPLASVLEGGTWQAGRELAKAKRADGSPPVSIRTAPSSEEGLRGAFSSPYSSTLAFSPSTCPPLLGGLRRKGTLPTSTGVHRDGDGRALGATRSATSCAAPLRMRTEV